MGGTNILSIILAPYLSHSLTIDGHLHNGIKTGILEHGVQVAPNIYNGLHDLILTTINLVVDKYLHKLQHGPHGAHLVLHTNIEVIGLTSIKL